MNLDKQGWQDDLRIGDRLEINFTISKFRELPMEDQVRLANLIRESPENSTNYIDAGCEVFDLASEAPIMELTEFVKNNSPEMGFVTLYIILPKDCPAKARITTKYFRENLSPEKDSVEIPEIELKRLATKEG